MKWHLQYWLHRLLGARGYDSLRSGLWLISRREYYAVFRDVDKCRRAALKAKDEHEQWKAILRMCAHILDKGCLRHDFEPGHSAEIYAKAIRALEQIEASNITDDATVDWAKEVIATYEIMQSHPENRPKSHRIPDPPPYELAIALMQSRHSCRIFTNRPVSENIANKIAEAGLTAPTSCNRQTIRIYVTVNAKLARECLSQCIGGTGFSDYVPSFFCFAVDIRSYQLPAECFTMQIDASLAAQNCVLAATSLELSMTMLSWASHSDAANTFLHDHLNIPEYALIVLGAVAGHIDEVRGMFPSRMATNVACRVIS